jgi:uncharacterized protein YukE
MAGAREFEVDPEALHRAAGAFNDAAARLASAVDRFAASAQPHPEAFGLLPQAQAAHGRYVAKAREAQDGLRSVHEALGGSLAGGLRANAANYVRADRDSTRRR